MTSTRSSKRPGFPSLRRCNGRGFVELNDRRIYLGPWGEPATQEAYERTLAEWLENGRRLSVSPYAMTVVEVGAAYFEHAKEYYRRPDGTLTTSIDSVKEAVRITRQLYGRLSAVEFGPLCLRTVRKVWVDRGLARKTVNSYTLPRRSGRPL